jgi:hypothetical protein
MTATILRNCEANNVVLFNDCQQFGLELERIASVESIL